MSITPEKLQEISGVVSKWDSQKSCSKNQLQSLLGSLLYVSKCVRFARFFLNRMLETLRCCGSSKTVNLDADFHRDRIWFKKFLNKFNGKSFFVKTTVDLEIHLDACLTGMGAVFGNEVYHIATPDFLKSDNIATLEMFNILVAIRKIQTIDF